MCLGCGARAPQATLLRFSRRPDGTLAPVNARRCAGRSGYLHRQPQCWDRFAARGGALRSLGHAVDKPTRRAFVEGLKAAEQSAMVR
jgi:predicted RNA-binding protein YlxR (DUF448 family)